MPVFNGNAGFAKLAHGSAPTTYTTVLRVLNWTLNVSYTNVDITAMGASGGYRQFLHNIRTGDATIVAVLDTTLHTGTEFYTTLNDDIFTVGPTGTQIIDDTGTQEAPNNNYVVMLLGVMEDNDFSVYFRVRGKVLATSVANDFSNRAEYTLQIQLSGDHTDSTNSFDVGAGLKLTSFEIEE